MENGPHETHAFPELGMTPGFSSHVIIMTDEPEITIDPLTKLAGEFDAFKSEFENLKQDYAKIKGDNTALIETNRKLLGELGRMTAPTPKEPEPSKADLAYNAFMKTSGFKE